ncbi:hypothetical protein F5144DRAFT_647929 [Chaetomium tenue]|uniref:Uncharacterized protein n=1 Tax=Chaetomium tenue TaxID=1854479 RepID=A0ACB7P5L3_9PEZI|nr:hypothetical protein F5144DRAFT_647929 [Chaetomium globosum]
MARQLPFAEPGPDWHWGMSPDDDDANPGWHVAKDKSWFVCYAPLRGVTAYPHDNEDPKERLEVAGVGTVMVQLPSTPFKGPRTVHLLKVLHIPEIKYGIICNKRLEKTECKKFKVDVDHPSYPNGTVRDTNTNEIVAVFDGNSPVPKRRHLIVSLHDLSRGDTQGSAAHEDLFPTGECWAQYVTVKEEHWCIIDEAYEHAPPV